MNAAHYVKLLKSVIKSIYGKNARLRFASRTASLSEGSQNGTTHFGFQTIKEGEKQQKGLEFKV